MRLKDGDFIGSERNEDKANGIMDRCNRVLRATDMADNWRAVVTYMVMGEDKHTGRKHWTYAITARDIVAHPFEPWETDPIERIVQCAKSQ